MHMKIEIEIKIEIKIEARPIRIEQAEIEIAD